MKSTKGVWVRGIVFSLIPAICSYLGQSSNVLDWLQKGKYIGTNVNISIVKEGASVLGIVLTFLLLTANLIKAELVSNKYCMQSTHFIAYNKEIFEKIFNERLKIQQCHLDIRIFVPKLTLADRVLRVLKIDLRSSYFHIKNVPGLAPIDSTSHLKFKVLPQHEGLVGDCFEKRAIIYDDDLKNSNDKKYNLNQYQISKTSELKFILVCPIFDENDKLIAIISFDSKDSIHVEKESEDALRRMVSNYTQQLYECAPDLFKPIGGIV